MLSICLKDNNPLEFVPNTFTIKELNKIMKRLCVDNYSILPSCGKIIKEEEFETIMNDSSNNKKCPYCPIIFENLQICNFGATKIGQC